MKKYCLVSFCNMYLLPYANTYINMIKSKGYKCDLLFWDRDINENRDNFPYCRKITFEYNLSNVDSLYKKANGYIKAIHFFCSVLKKEKYDGVIFLQSHAAVACIQLLIKKYKKKYIIDIRDFSLENYYIYRELEKITISCAHTTIISSPAYKCFLPKNQYVIAHNYNEFSEKEISKYLDDKEQCKDSAIRISFVGTVRFLDMDKKILKLFANDKRFTICYFGRGSEQLKEYCENNRISNVMFYGSFSPEQTIQFYARTDLINNLYGNNTPYLDYALSNKLYHSAMLCLPILVCPNTYMAKVVSKYKLGFVLDVEDTNSPNQLYSWYNKKKSICQGANRFLHKVKQDNELFIASINSFLDSK